MKAIGIGVIVEGAAHSIVSMTHAEFNRLSVFLIGSMLTGHCITTRSILWPIEWYTIDCYGDFTKCSSAFIVAVCFWAVS